MPVICQRAATSRLQSAMTSMDSSLQRYLANDDPASFRELVCKYHDLVHGVCRRILGRGLDIDDAVQETFIKLSLKAADIRENPTAWLLTCARTTALDLKRRRMRRARKETQASAVSRGKSPGLVEKVCERAEELSIVEACVEELPELDRHVLTAYFYVDQTQQEIAESLGVSQVAIKKRLARVLEVLRWKCVNRGLAAPAAMAAFLSDLNAATRADAVPRLAQDEVAESCRQAARSQCSALAKVALVQKCAAAGCALVVFAACWMILGHPAPQLTPPAHLIPPAHPSAAPVSNMVIWHPLLEGELPGWHFLDLDHQIDHIEQSGASVPALHLKSQRSDFQGWMATPTVHLPRHFLIEYDVQQKQRMSARTGIFVALMSPRNAGTSGARSLRGTDIADGMIDAPLGSWFHCRDEFTMEAVDGGFTSIRTDHYLNDVLQDSWQVDRARPSGEIGFGVFNLDVYITNIRLTAID
jgi:RNA polymerase sigma factor (sigma-70 family)